MWKTIGQWKESGPSNGTPMVVLLPDGDRRIAIFSGHSQRWVCKVTSEALPSPVGWDHMPEVPAALIERLAKIAEARASLNRLEQASL